MFTALTLLSSLGLSSARTRLVLGEAILKVAEVVDYMGAQDSGPSNTWQGRLLSSARMLVPGPAHSSQYKATAAPPQLSLVTGHHHCQAAWPTQLLPSSLLH